jgi:hypothetical protein
MFVGMQSLKAQEVSQLLKGNFNGSYENYTQYYMQDNEIGAVLPPDKFGSNGFLKLDYNYGKFSAGIQIESYLPSVLGYFPISLENQTKIVNKYFKYTDKKFSVQVGDFYEQFGSGLVFRSFENRQIGINNALEGFNVHIQPTSFMKVKTIYGRTRKLFEYTNSLTRGLDAEVNINELLKAKTNAPIEFNIGASYVSKYEEYVGPVDNFPTQVNAISGRFDLTAGNFTIDGEYVEKTADPHQLNKESFEKGKALQINTGFTQNNFGISLTLRTLSNMNFKAEREGEFMSIAPLNYIPALTKQHDYLTSNIYVYAAQVMGETGLQSDLYYTFKPGSTIGGKYGTKISANFSLYHSLEDSLDILSIGSKKYFSDANIEIKKKWSKKFETSFALQKLFYNTSVIQSAGKESVNAIMVAFGGLYKWARQKSVRFKFEHLSTKQDAGNWASALTELSFRSPWAFFASDLFNYGVTDVHYYNFGTSYTQNATRFSLGYGRQRAGLFCVGGVCRFVPASYGFTATLTTSFAN